jgi:hypothetical protein
VKTTTPYLSFSLLQKRGWGKTTFIHLSPPLPLAERGLEGEAFSVEMKFSKKIIKLV